MQAIPIEEDVDILCIPVPILSEVSPSSEDDEALMARIATCDQTALETLIARYSRIISGVIFGVTHDEIETKEVLMEVFLHCWANVSQYSPEKGKLLGWLITMARRKGIDRMRKRQRYSAATERLQLEVEQDPSAWMSHRDADGNIERADIQSFVKAEIEQLPAFQRDVIKFAFYKGMTHREIATQTGIPLGTIKTRIDLGLKKLSVSLRVLSSSAKGSQAANRVTVFQFESDNN